MAGGYSAADSPRDSFSDERYGKLVQETSKGIAGFNQLTRSIAQKMSLFGTPQDSRANHKQLNELVDKGNKIVTKIQRRLKDLAQACQGPQARARKTQVNKLSTDFKNQLRSFEETCKRLVESEKNAVDLIRRSSTSFRNSDDMNKPANNNNNGMNFTNYNEDQIYAQANIVMYDEDGTKVDDTLPCSARWLMALWLMHQTWREEKKTSSTSTISCARSTPRSRRSMG